MDENRAILISDVHMDQWETDLGTNGAADKRRAFLDFLDWVRTSSRAKRFIICGDLLDIPTRTGAALLPQYLDVAQKLAELVNADIEFTYVVGNHDSGIVGLEVAMTDPTIRVDYPWVRLKSGGKVFLLEHGHLYDPWLWEYVRYHGATMLKREPRKPGMLTLMGPRAAAATDAMDPDGLREGVLEMWQVHREEAAYQGDRVHALAAAVETAIAQDYEGREPDAKGQQALQDLKHVKTALPAAPGAGPHTFSLAVPSWDDVKDHVGNLVTYLYSGPHWRRVARQRVTDLAGDPNTRIDGVVMGHTHYADHDTWEEAGSTYQYVNSGSWRNDSADMVLIESGKLKLYKRTWTDGWPALPR